MSRPRPRGRILAALGAAAVTTASLVATLGAAPASARPDHDDHGRHHGRHHGTSHKQVKLQILALNDFHGQLEPS